MSSRDEQLEALQAALKSAETKLKNAKISYDDISDKLNESDERFQRKFEDKAAGYKAQSGVNFVRTVDENGKSTYSFTRETTQKERQRQRNFKLSREYNSQTGKSRFRAKLEGGEKKTINVTSAADLEKPEDRKKFISYDFFGYHKLSLSAEDHPILEKLGTPVLVPAQAAAYIAEKVTESPVGKVVSTSAKAAVAPIILPAKIVKDIHDKGGIIHSVVDLGDKIKIEGVNVPKPLKTVGEAAKNAALGAETLSVGTTKSIGKFSIDVAKEKIYEEINKGVSENEATQAAYVIGMKAAEVYRILDEHAKFRRSVFRDQAGDDITDVKVSLYLADKEEAKFQKERKKLENQANKAKKDVDEARAEYEKARRRLDEYTGGQTTLSDLAEEATSRTSLAEEPVSLTKTEKKIGKTKKKLESLKEKEQPKPVADLKTTVKRLDGLAVGTAMTSLRRKAIRDGGDNVAIEAANSGIVTAKAAHRLNLSLNEKEIALKEQHYKKKLTSLENQKELEEAAPRHKELHESETNRAKSKKTPEKKKPDSKKRHELQKKGNKKKQAVKAHKTYVKQQKAREVEKVVSGGVKALIGGSSTPLLFIILIILLIFILIGGIIVGITGTSVAGMQSAAFSPCSTNDISRCDQYYTELGKNLIDLHQNVQDVYVGYDKYVCLTEIDEITHSPEKLLPYLSVKTMDGDEDKEEWTFEEAKPYIEEIFNEQYEFYANEVYEVRKSVKTTTYSNEDEYYHELGTTTYQLELPYGVNNLPAEIKSSDYKSRAHTYVHVEALIFSGDYWGYIDNTLENVGEFTDLDGNTTTYDVGQTITFHNNWKIELIFDWQAQEGRYLEYWRYTEEIQEYYEYDYAALEYAIIEKEPTVSDDYGYDEIIEWKDTNFEKIIYNHLSCLDEDTQERFQVYCAFLMGHQMLTLPIEPPVNITKQAGYDNRINGNMQLDMAIEFETYSGQDIICGMDGEITPLNDQSFYIYNKEYGTLYYDNVEVPSETKAVHGNVISKAKGDRLRITFIDNDDNYINPLFLFGE